MDVSQSSEDLDTLYEVDVYFNKSSGFFLRLRFTRCLSVVAFFVFLPSQLWQMSLEHSGLLCSLACPEPDCPGPHPSTVSAGAVESGVVPSSPEQEPSSRPERGPAAGGCVQMAPTPICLSVPITFPPFIIIILWCMVHWGWKYASDDFNQFNLTLII